VKNVLGGLDEKGKGTVSEGTVGFVEGAAFEMSLEGEGFYERVDLRGFCRKR
jgi:hypothetical protein